MRNNFLAQTGFAAAEGEAGNAGDAVRFKDFLAQAGLASADACSLLGEGDENVVVTGAGDRVAQAGLESAGVEEDDCVRPSLV